MEQHYKSKNTKDAVEKDFLLAREYDIQGVPCLIINGKQQISGAQPLSRIVQLINGIMDDHIEKV